jgi:hypothetical protein
VPAAAGSARGCAPAARRAECALLGPGAGRTHRAEGRRGRYGEGARRMFASTRYTTFCIRVRRDFTAGRAAGRTSRICETRMNRARRARTRGALTSHKG